MNISFEIYTISSAFKESDGKLKIPPAQNSLTYGAARELMEQIAKDWESEDGTVEKQIWRNTDTFDSVVRFHGNDGREYMWKLTKQIISKSY